MTSKTTETYLINQVVQGSQSAFRRLILKYQDYVFSVCYSVLKNSDEAEEAAQDTFMKVYKSIDSYNFSSKFSTWLYSIAYRTSIDYYRKRKHTENLDEVDYNLAGTVDDSSREIEKQELSAIIQMAVEELTQEEGTLITLFYLKEQSIKEIQSITELNESNIKVKLFRARKKLYQIM